MDLRNFPKHFKILLLFIGVIHVTDSYYLIYKTTKLDCFLYPSYFDEVSCKIRKESGTRVFSEFHALIKKPLRDVTIHIKTYKRNSAKQYKPSSVDLKFKLCNVLGGQSLILSSLVKNIISSQLNFTRTCPFTGEIEGKNIFIDEKYMPPSGREGKFMVTVRVFDGPQELEAGNVTAYVDLVDRDNPLRSRNAKKTK